MSHTATAASPGSVSTAPETWGVIAPTETPKNQTLYSYGPTHDEDYVHVPIDEAMKQLANKLPVREAPSAEQARREGGLVDAGESNSGRMFRKK